MSWTSLGMTPIMFGSWSFPFRRQLGENYIKTYTFQAFQSLFFSIFFFILPPSCVFCQRTSAHRQILSHCSRPEHLHTSRQKITHLVSRFRLVFPGFWCVSHWSVFHCTSYLWQSSEPQHCRTALELYWTGTRGQSSTVYPVKKRWQWWSACVYGNNKTSCMELWPSE